MSWVMGWLPEPNWLTVFFVSLAFVSILTVVEKFVKKKIRERNKEENQQKKSSPENLSGKFGGSAVVQVRSAKDERDRYKAESEVEEKSKELTKLWSDFKGLQKQHGQLRVELYCSVIRSQMDLSVAVQFINISDIKLAKQITGYFRSLRGQRNLKEIKQIPWHENPSDSARVVIFWDHENASGLTAAFNECGLLEEGVDHRPKESRMVEEITIIVFNKDN